MKRKLSMILLLSAALILSGCASKYGPKMTDVHFYPQCYRPIEALHQEEAGVSKSTAVGAGLGALFGAILGYAATGKARGALVGATAGAAVGGVGGNIYGKHRMRSNDAEYLSRYALMLDEDTRGMSRATAAAKVSIQCYNGEFHAAAEAFKAGRMSREEFRERYAEIRNGLQETSNILHGYYSDMSIKDAEYEQALEDEYRIAKAEAEAEHEYYIQQQSRAQGNPSYVPPMPKPQPKSGISPSYQRAKKRAKSLHEMRDTGKKAERDIQSYDRYLSEVLSL